MTIRHLIRKLIIPRMMAPFALLSVMHSNGKPMTNVRQSLPL